jgi:hypothetical protein
MVDLVLQDVARASAVARKRPLAWFAWATLGVFSLVSAYVLWRAAVLKPYSDTFSYMARYYELQADGDLARYLFTPHNMHRLVWPLALQALDVRMFGGTGVLAIASGAAGLGVMAWLLGRAACRASTPPLALPLGVAAAMLVLMAGNVLDAAIPLNAQYVQTAAFGVAALVLAEGRDDGPVGWRGLAVAACAIGSAFGCGGGLALWPALAFGAMLRRDWRWLAILLVVGTIFVALYLGWPHAAGSTGGLQAPAGRPSAAIVLMLDTLGLPWSRLSGPAGPAEGGMILLLSLVALLTKPRDSAGRLARTLIAFSLVTAVMAGFGRADLGPIAPIRYGIMLAPAQVGLLMLAAPHVQRLWLSHPRVVEVAIPAALSLLLLQHVLMGVAAIRGSDRLRFLIADFEAGDRSPATMAVICSDRRFVESMSARLRADHYFQRELHLDARPRSR